MPRPPRIHLPGGFYHTTLRGNHREHIFSVDSDRLLLNTIVELAIAKHGARVHAYCWMTNHVHMLVQVGADPLSELMHRIASGYARAYQANRETTGHLFENRFHSVLVDTDAYLLELIRYIHLNPVRAGLAARVELYRWSSHHAYNGLNVDRWVTTDFAWQMFGRERYRAIAAYREFVACDVKEIRSPLDAVHRDQPNILGSDAFIARVHRQPERSPPPRTLSSLIEEGCKQHSLPCTAVLGHRRGARVASARAWIVRQAVAQRLATITELSRALQCDPKTIRSALREQPDES